MELLGIPMETLTAGGLLGLTVLLILFGKLVPSGTLKAKDEEARVWRENYHIEREARVELMEALQALAQATKTTEKVLKSLPTVADAEDFEITEKGEGRKHEFPRQKK